MSAMSAMAVVVLLGLVFHAAGHAMLTVPHSKNNGFPGSYALDRSDYYTTASWWLDRAYFGTPKVTPWMQPGHFSWADARDLPDVTQTFHPCGCYNPHGVEFCAGVELAQGFGETSMGPSVGPKVTPPRWPRGTQQVTAFNMYANHGGGYIYMLCKRTEFLQCRTDHLSEPIRSSTREQQDAYLKCIWDCFESHVLDFADSQWLEYQEQKDMNVTMKPSNREGLPSQSTWRWIPIPDTTQITGGGDGMCSWDAVDSFSNDAVKLRFTEDFGAENVCDTGPKVHNPNNWQVKDKIILPDNLPVGEYLLSWRWDCYMADQIWSNCADVEITDSAIETTTPVSTSTTTSTTSIASTTSTTSPSSGCIDGELPTEWSQAGRFDCNYFRERGAAYSNPLAYCAHAAIRNTCCFCESALRQKHRALRRGHAKHLHQAALALIQNASKVRKSDPSEL